MVCLKVAIVPIVFDPNAFWAFSQPKVLASHAFDYILLGLLAASALYHGRAMWRWSPLHVPVLAFGAAYLLATLFALDGRVAIYGTADRSLGLLSVLDSLLLYAAVVMLLRTRRDLAWLAASLAASVVLVVAYEVAQWVGVDPLEWSQGGVFATLGNRGPLAQLLGTLGVAFAAAAVAPRDVGWRVRAGLGSVAAVSAGGALLSGGRAALLGIGAGTAVAATVRVLWEERRQARAVGAAVAAVAVAAVIAGALFTPTGQRVVAFLRDPGALVSGAFETSDLSLASRLDIYRVAFSAWLDRPIVGVGPDNFEVAFPRYRTPEGNKVHDSLGLQTSTHGWIPKIASDAGLLGLGSFLAAAVLALWLVVRGERSPWRLGAAGGIAAFLGTGLVSIDHIGTQWLPWLGLGVVAARLSLADRVPDAAQPTRRPGRAAPRGGVGGRDLLAAVAVALGLVLAQVAVNGPLEAARAAQLARVGLAKGAELLNVARAAAEQSVRLDPGRAEYWAQVAAASSRYGDAARAEAAWGRAAALEPFQAQYLANQAKEQVNLALAGDAAARVAALTNAERAAKVDPYFPDAQYALALAANINRRPKEAAAAAEMWLRLRASTDPLLTEAAAGAYLGLGKATDAERWLRLVLRADGPDQPRLRVLLARALEMQGRRADALAQLDLALKADPKNEDALRLRMEIGQ